VEGVVMKERVNWIAHRVVVRMKRLMRREKGVVWMHVKGPYYASKCGPLYR